LISWSPIPNSIRGRSSQTLARAEPSSSWRRRCDSGSNPQRSIWGIYAVHPFAPLPHGHTDLYYLGYENRMAGFDQGTAYELRHSLGIRLWGQPLPWEYDVESIWQFGTFGSGTIRAWAVASTTHYTFDNLPLHPRVGLRADVTSGDHNPKSTDLQTFNPLFPTGAYYNLQDPAGPQNFIHVHPVLDLHLGEKITATVDWAFFWRVSLKDGIYRLSGRSSNGPKNGQRKYDILR
jgi:hypothetical protein